MFTEHEQVFRYPEHVSRLAREVLSSQVLHTWYQVLGTWRNASGTACTRGQATATRYLVPNTGTLRPLSNDGAFQELIVLILTKMDHFSKPFKKGLC